MDSQQFEPGDHVYAGYASPDKVHWEIESIDDGWATIRSPMSDRRKYLPVTYLTLHSRKDAA